MKTQEMSIIKMVMSIKYYLNTFLLYAVIGFIIETLLKIFLYPSINNGILIGPWNPIYGFGAIIIVFITNYIRKTLKINKWIKRIITLIIIMILLTVLEYLGGTLIEFFFDEKFWDYRNMRFNIGAFISLEMMLVWGGMSLLFTYLLKPVSDKLIKKIPIYISISILIIIVVDLVATMLKAF